MNQNFTFLPPQKPHSSIHTTLSNLKNLIDIAETTLNSTTNLLNLSNEQQKDDFIPCPFNSNHRMPPQYLFPHTLKCQNSIDFTLLDSLHYPNSIKSQDELRKDNLFLQCLSEGDGDLCFSIDGYGDFGLNFFYKDCPGVYCSSSSEVETTSKRTFTLPSVLSIHCANFVVSSDVRISKCVSNECLGIILPSDFLALRSEVERWNGFPSLYGFSVLKVVSCLQMVKDSDLLKWVISNSPFYGIVIDVPMRDHICLLLRLCLKAVAVEAHWLNESMSNKDVKEGNVRSLNFNCPVLVEAMNWLASQLSVLYGEANGRFFAINMLKHCVLNAASSALLFSSEKEKIGISASKEGCGKLCDTITEMDSEFSSDKVVGNVKVRELPEECERENLLSTENTSHGLVFVSQIAAAIAALHERSLLEEKIKGLRDAQSISKSQLLAEHSYVTTRADEERRKRSNYRPIVEHDGLLWHRSRNQDSNKSKTREEFLAEERDYKRRRMSYRGKKVKRSKTEVLRDIIEEHMDEIKEAGGIGCFVKGSAESGVFPPRSVSVNDVTTDDKLKRNLGDSPEPSRGQSHGNWKLLQSKHRNESIKLEGSPSENHLDTKNSHERQRRKSHGPRESLEDHKRSSRKEKRDKEYRSRSPERDRSRGRSYEKHKHRRDKNEIERARTKYGKHDSVASHRSYYRDNRHISSVSDPPTDDSEYDQMSESKDQLRGRRYGSRRSESVAHSMFEDRYDPSVSDSTCEDAFEDRSSGSKYVRQDKLYNLNNEKCMDETQRTRYTEEGCYHKPHEKS